MGNIRSFLILVLFCGFSVFTKAQTADPIPSKVFEITGILVDACGEPEGENEMVSFKVGPNPVNVNHLRIDGSINSISITNGQWPNGTYSWLGVGTLSQAKKNLIANLNNANTCGGKLLEPPGGILPAGADVLLITSTDFDLYAHDFSCLTDTLYIICQTAGQTTGHFRNYDPSVSYRKLRLTHTPTLASDTVTYYVNYLINQSGVSVAADGAGVRFTWSGDATYYNDGCQVPQVITYKFDSICAGQSYVLPNNTVVTASGTYPVILTSNCGCDSIVTTILNVIPAPAVNISATANSICAGASTTLTANGSGTFSWSPSTGLNTTSGSSVTAAPAATTTYTVTANLNGCANSASITVTVTPYVTPVFNISGSYCVGAAPGTLPVTSNNGIAGSWNPAAISTTAAGTTVHTFTPEAGQCANSTTVSVTVSDNLTPTFDALGPYCENAAPVAFSSTSTNGISGSWNPAVINTAVAGITTYTFTPTTGVCTATATMAVTVNASITPAFATLGPYCLGETSGTLPAVSVNGIPGTWGPSSISTASAGTATYTFTPDAGQCATLATMDVITKAYVMPVFQDMGPFCVGNVPAVLPDTSANGVAGNWVPAHISTANAGTTTYTFFPMAGECSSAPTSVIHINVLPAPGVMIISDTSAICPGDHIGLHATGGYVSYLWNNGMDNSDIIIDHGGLFTVRIWDGLNCYNYDSIYIDEDCLSTLYIPNAFTPDGDGLNDFFTISGENILSMKLWIYDRWGEMVFYSDNIAHSWDGKFKGAAVPAGLFGWYMEYESYHVKAVSNLKSRTGYVNVIR